jgi:hypothetical protein
LRSQIDDYRYRGEALEHLSFLEFIADTYEERLSKSSDNDVSDNTEHSPAAVRQPGRPRNQRVRYQSLHPRADTSQRIVRSIGHHNLPDIVGPWIERNDNPATFDLHCASALACLQPWRAIGDLKGEHTSWKQTLESFLISTNDLRRCIYHNIQYYYQCRQSADRSSDMSTGACRAEEPITPGDLSEFVNGIAVEDLVLSSRKKKELDHGEDAAAVGKNLGLFGDVAGGAWGIQQEGPRVAGEAEYRDVEQWTRALKTAAVEERSGERRAASGDMDLGAIESITESGPQSSLMAAGIVYEGDAIQPASSEVDVSMLGPDQLRAFKIIEDHVKRSATEKMPQLLMQIQGEGGTGKSKVISKVTELFKTLGRESTLRRSAYTGIAASLIEGSTLHQLALLHQSSKPLSKKSVDRLRATWGDVEYLIINEVSMISKQTLAALDEMISIGKQKEGENNSTVAFGGVHVILAGDFHQFPPVIGKGKGRGALYSPAIPSHGVKGVLGRELYERFRTVVILRQQFRNKDPGWQAVLHRARYGQCTRDDLNIIRTLIIDPKRDRDVLTGRDSLWQNSVLVTPRHSVRNKWNELASRYHCQKTGQKLIQSHAYDTHNNQPLIRKLQLLVDSRTLSLDEGQSVSRGDPGGLPDTVQLAKGMSVMVTYNVETEMDVANGARGTIEAVIIHKDSEKVDKEQGNSSIMNLTRPPACVLVRLDRRGKTKTLPGLGPDIVPIVPIRNRFQFTLSKGKQITLWREQLPLTPAYAFTDYRSQGQTLPYVIIDLATPPSGGLTPFNAYVALSRSESRENARLLWNFDNKLFTSPADVNLVKEDTRLEELHTTTRHEYKHLGM